ncbi:MAG: pitrilysin family protein [Planctomycetota bacterium]
MISLKRLENRFGEEVLTGTCQSGLRVTLVPKPDYSKTFGVFSTRFGSADNGFLDRMSGKTVTVPDGVAHFLEHKLFEDEKGDVSDRFSALGASCNASTSFTTTSYIFTATRNVEQCLDLLLNFVQNPYFTEELVQKEQGIIGQEIRMYDDDPSWRIFFNLLGALFREHPVRINIAGTEESIARIDPAVLHTCYRAFYRPGNMAFTLVGRMDVDRVAGQIERDQDSRVPDREGQSSRAFVNDGPIREPEATQTMDVALPKLLLGYKDRIAGGGGRDTVRRELLSGIALDLLFGRSSESHERLYAEGLIDDSFSAEYTTDVDFGFCMLGGDSERPELMEKHLLKEIDRFLESGCRKEDFERVRNKFLGKFVSMFDSLEATAHAFCGGVLRGVTPFEVLEILNEVSSDEVTARARSLLDASFRARSLVLPRAAETA